MPEKIVLVNDLSPGDILIMSVAIRSLQKAYPGKYLLDVRSPCNEIFMNSPYVTKLPIPDPAAANKVIEELKRDETHPPIMLGDTKYMISHYPEIHRSMLTGLPFCDGHRMFLEKQLATPIPRSGMEPDIFLSNAELKYPRQVQGQYWLINAGIKNDYTLKWYPYYQQVVDLLKGKIQFVQIGHTAHNHPPLKNVIDMRGKTPSLRQLFLLSYYAQGAVCAVSLQMVIQAAFKKPCVVVAGAREGVRWQLNPDHRYLYLNGSMRCATYDGCWKSRLEECTFKTKNNVPMCMELIRPEDIARAVETYYLGGRLTYEPSNPVILNPKKEEPMPVQKAVDIAKQEPPIIPTPVDPDPALIKQEMVEKTSVKVFPFPETINLPQINSAIFNTLRILKKLNPTDTYLEAYQWHYGKRKELFMDTYHYMWYLGAVVKPKNILEIGTRTGLSICQLLSAYLDHKQIENIILCDLFNDGLCTPDVVIKSMKHLNIPIDKVGFIVGDSLMEIPKLASEQPDLKFDYILVDGGHDKDIARMDLENSAGLLAKGGHLVFDDITPDGCSLQDVWDQFKETHPMEFQFFENHNGKGLGVGVKI
jgi:predicted O-methyltransferase YrrM/ADP-heptose:LPS heptosyltransferase